MSWDTLSGVQSDAEFNTKDEQGKVGEDRFKQWAELYISGNPHIDVSGDDKFHRADVDFLIYYKGVYIPIDAKTDVNMSITGNIVYETRNYNQEGWSVRTTAKYIYYTSLQNPNMTYWIEMNKFREYVNKHSQQLRYKEFNSGRSAGYLCRVTDLVIAGVAEQITNQDIRYFLEKSE